MHFVIEEHGRRTDTHRDISPELDLVRGQPVAITIVNRLDEPTSVHWRGIGIEDSYMDGAPGFSGAGRHLAPAIAPGDSFVARFTPPRPAQDVVSVGETFDFEYTPDRPGTLRLELRTSGGQHRLAIRVPIRVE